VSLQETVCRAKAREVLQKFMVGAPDEIDLATIAWSTGRLTIEIGNLETAEGRLVASRGGGCIRVSEAVHNEARRRFIVGHELGHFCLHKAASALDTAAELADWRSGSRETEANIFSGELLMPDFLFKPLLGSTEPSLGLLDALATQFATSTLATGVRYATYTTEPVALIVSRGQKVLWCRKSESFEFWIRDTLHPYSAAHEILFGKGSDTRKMVEVPALAWLPEFEGDDDPEIKEDARRVRAYDMIVSLLWIDECI